MSINTIIYFTNIEYTKNGALMSKRCSEESNNEKERRLVANRKRIVLTRSQESLDQREESLADLRNLVCVSYCL